MGEKNKQEQRQKFRQTCERFNVGEDIVETCKQIKLEIARYEEDLKIATSQFAESHAERKTLERAIVSRAERLATEVNAMPFWRRCLSFIWEIPKNLELNTTNQELSIFVVETHRLSQEQQYGKFNTLAKIEVAEKKAADIGIAIKELEIHQDGEIIGDGQSDFTRESTGYEFTAMGKKFVLLDVPGIEGKEELVGESIMQAVRKAHVVFYITRKAEPPQKGDEKTGEKGTLEKIKDHLGAQTEVWAIFNKSIKSAEQLRAPQLVNMGELDSLKVMEDEMRKQLGGHYAGSLSVSAYPAFVASTDHFLPGNAKSKDRRKFLAVMDAAEILQKTGIQSLAEKICTDVAENTEAKIRKSNFNKANNAVLQLKEKVSALNKNNFEPLLEHLEEQARASIFQLESATDALKSNIESGANLLFRKTRDNIRKSIYTKIESDIGNDDFKHFLGDYIKADVEKIENDLPSVIKILTESFQDEVKDIANQFQEHVQEFMDDASMSGNNDFILNIKIDSGVNVGALISTLVGVVTLFFVSGGWALVFGALGIVVSFAKAIRKLIDSNYKKAQQRKAADENIDKMFLAIESSYISQLEENMQKLDEKLAYIKSKFQLPAQQAELIASSLKSSIRQLELVSQKIVNESEL